ncbi:hypothetical protein [Paenibacillus xylanexedens]|uniref:hypothetical protein n=1 Tax=Paenibacillus xylanexedens TaxID=528191 RepID=UPI00119E153F|nr:hypothetical protein [Paenibacillus xylanexedens]
MSKEMYASILLQHVYTFDPDERERIALISATFIGIVDSIVNQADYTTAQKMTKIRNLNEARKEVLADE